MDNARQQIVDSIKKSSNILVTVSTNPSVDELSAALGLSIILNNQDKRATAIFSGATPPAITFLESDKTFENSADSLRDFIIALDKEKADHLRYKVDGDVVKIFITPYKTTLSEKDLEFSLGDYNVDLVVALGVKDQAHLDKALEAHGKILHDATVTTITTGSEGSNLGSIGWHDEKASSLSEMIVNLADGIKGETPIFDAQIATALLTGIVSATARFSNDKTTSKAMTMAAQLMSAGANQQLIAAKLEEAHDITPGPVAKKEDAPSKESSSESNSSELTIERDENNKPKTDEKPVEPAVESSAEAKPAADQPAEQPSNEEVAQKQLEKDLAGLNGDSAETPDTGTLESIEKELEQATAQPEASAPASAAETEAVVEVPPAPVVTPEPAAPEVPPLPSAPAVPVSEPILAVPPAEATPDNFTMPTLPEIPPASEEPEAPAEPPHIVNQHGKISSTPPSGMPPINSIQANPNDGELPSIDPFNTPAAPLQTTTLPPADPAISSIPTIEPLPPASNVGTPEGAAILASGPEPAAPAPAAPTPAPQPAELTIPELPPLPPMPADASSLPPLPPPPPPPTTLGQPPANMPSGAVSGDVFGDGTAPQTPPAPTPPPTEPGQFKIPGSPS